MGSRRLPGKVLAEVRGKSLLDYLIERLERCAELDGLVLATSREAIDDRIGAFAARRGVACHRGSLEDVAERMLTAARAEHCDAFVRISGDSPLIDSGLVDRAVKLFRDESPDVVTNVHVRTFPTGQSVEVISIGAMTRAHRAMRTRAHREHVTPYFYAHPERFRILGFTADAPWGGLQLSVDSAEDLVRFERIVAHLGEPHWRHGLEAVVAAARAVEDKRAGGGGGP